MERGMPKLRWREYISCGGVARVVGRTPSLTRSAPKTASSWRSLFCTDALYEKVGFTSSSSMGGRESVRRS